MRLFGSLYDRVLAWAAHRAAPRYLVVVSFFESSVFPIPTAVMLLPMLLSTPGRAWRLAGLTTLSSVAGGVFGYMLGAFLFVELGEPLLALYGAEAEFAEVRAGFLRYGTALVLLAGLTPLPYKLCTLAAGVMGLPLVGFIAASLIGRAGQFYLLAGIIRLGGEKLERQLRHYIEWIGWALVAALLVYIVWGWGG